MTINKDWYAMDDVLGAGEAIICDGRGNYFPAEDPNFDPIGETELVSDATFQKFYKTSLRKTALDLSGYLQALRKLPSKSERRALLHGYSKELIPALKEILESEGLL